MKPKYELGGYAYATGERKWINIFPSEYLTEIYSIRIYNDDAVKIDSYGTNIYLQPNEVEEFTQLIVMAQQGYEDLYKFLVEEKTDGET